MRARGLLKLFVGVIGLLFVATLFAAGGFIAVANWGLPFIEGDHRVTSGEAYSFKIGMTKPEVFEALKVNYSEEEYYLRTLWPRNSSFSKELVAFENTELRDYGGRQYSENEVLIKELQLITPPLFYTSRWDIQMPSSWVNDIYLEFEDEHLVGIQKSRWLFERP